MKQMDSDGLILCDLIETVLEKSRNYYDMSSEFFIRRFMNSRVTARLFKGDPLFEIITELTVYEELYWIGNIYMYASYTYGYSFKALYRIFSFIVEYHKCCRLLII